MGGSFRRNVPPTAHLQRTGDPPNTDVISNTFAAVLYSVTTYCSTRSFPESRRRSPRQGGRCRSGAGRRWSRGDPEQIALGEARRSISRALSGAARAVRREASRRRRAGPPLKRWISSAILRLLAKVSVRSPRSTNAAWSFGKPPRAPTRAAQSFDIEQRRVPEDDGALGAGCCIVPDHRHGRSEERLAELARVRDLVARREAGIAARSRRSPRSGEDAAVRWQRCDPNTPRYTWASSTTASRRFASTSPRRSWLGSSPM